MRKLYSLILSLLTIGIFSLDLGAQVNPDYVVTKSGNTIEGEVKTLEFSILDFDTDQAGLLSIKWTDVVKIRSVSQFEITLPNGDLIIGKLDTTANDFEVKITDEEGKVTILPLLEVTGFESVNKTFWSRIDGFIKLGASYTKASQVAQFNAGAEVTYRTYHDEVGIYGNTVLTRQVEINDTVTVNRKQNLNAEYKRFFNHRWFVGVNSGVEQNTELGLLSRFLAGATVGKTLFQNKSQFFQASLGSTYTWERSDDGQSVNNAEGIVGVYYKVYKHSMPKIYLTTYCNTYPSFTTGGRVRVDAQIDFDIEIISDFTLGISNYHNYDNKPISATGSTYDWGFVFTVGYSF